MLHQLIDACQAAPAISVGHAQRRRGSIKRDKIKHDSDAGDEAVSKAESIVRRLLFSRSSHGISRPPKSKSRRNGVMLAHLVPPFRGPELPAD